MNAVTEITEILNNAGITANAGKYSGAADTEIAVVYGNGEVMKQSGSISSECVRVKIRSMNYRDMENAATTVKAAMKNSGCIPMGGITDLDEESDGKMQLALDFKVFKAS